MNFLSRISQPLSGRPLLGLLQLVTVVAGLLFFVSPSASGQILRDQVEMELNRTDQLIDRAEEAMRGFPDNDRLKEIFEQVKSLQDQARRAFREERYLVARGLTIQARDVLKRLASLARPTEQLGGGLQGRLERAENLLADARDEITGDGRPLQESLYQNARTNLDRAWEYYRKGEQRPATKLIEQVERAIEQLMGRDRLLNRGQEHFSRREEAVRRLIDEALAVATYCEDPVAKQNAESADELFRRGIQAHEERHPIVALKALQSARDLATQVIRECNKGSTGGVGGVGLDQLIRRMEQHRDRLIELIGTRNDEAADGARRFVQQATVQINEARQLLNQQKTDEAAINLKAAQLALRQAERRLAGR